MAHTFTSLQYHIVFSTKERRRLLTAENSQRIQAYIGGVIHNIGGEVICIGGIEDHVHILCSLKADVSVAQAARTVKANASKWIHETWPNLQDFAWQEGYGAFTVSRLKLDVMAAYIRDQETHHRQTTFQEEFVHLLKRHGIEYDDRYIWT